MDPAGDHGTAAQVMVTVGSEGGPVTQEGEATPSGRPATVAEKLTRLSAVMHPPGHPPVTSRELQERVRAAGGSISAAYISELRSGKKTNPSLDHIQRLAAAFGVSAGYFTDVEVAERVDQQLDRLEAQQDQAQLQQLAMRTAGLVSEVSPERREQLFLSLIHI